MTPSTPLSETEARDILRSYGLELHRVRPIGRGTINSNYRVDTPVGPLFLRINEGKSEDDVRFEAALIWQLGQGGVPTPAIWRTRRGEAYARMPSTGKAVTLFQWAAGVELTELQIGPGEARSVGELLGRMHVCLAPFPWRRRGIYTLGHIQRRIERLAREVSIPDGLVEFLEREAARLQAARAPELPRGIGHSDLFPDNLMFNDQRRAAWVLDLEQAAEVPYAYDVAVTLLSFCAPVPLGQGAEPRIGPLRAQEARALLAGYQAVRPLLASERAALPEELCFASLRFTVTRLTDVHLKARGGAAPSTPHSKDYRDFLSRLESLRSVGAAQLAALW